MGQLRDVATAMGYISGRVGPALFAVPSLPIATCPHRSRSLANTHPAGVTASGARSEARP